MKKSLIVLLSVMVVLAFAASAFALHAVQTSEITPGLVKAGKSQIELGGEIRIRGNLSKNTDFNDDNSDTSQKYDQRVRLRTKANITDKTMGVVELETTNNVSDNGTSSYDWGKPNFESRENRDTKRDALYIRQAYISHQFGTIGGMKAGHMLIGLGNRLFFDHTNYGDDAILGWLAIGTGELSLITVKMDESNDGNATQMDDQDAYVVAFEMPINDQINVSADVAYIRNNDKSVYDEGTDFFNVGVRADADLKVVKVKGDIEGQFGSAQEDVNGDEAKFKGMAAMLGVEGVVGPVTLRGGVAYGSGDDDPDDEDVEDFITLLTDNQYSTFVYDYSAVGASWTGRTNQGLTNTMYVNLGATMKPIPDLKVSADFYFLQANEDVALNGARDDQNSAVACTSAARDNCQMSDEIGYEIDAKVEYQIATNLVYYIEAGYLIAGEAYDRYDATEGENKDADDPYRVRHGLLLSF